MVARCASFWIGVAILLALLLGGCSNLATPVRPGTASVSSPTVSPSQSPLPAPTATAVPAPDYALGQLDLPKGLVLFLSHPTWRVCSKECDCPEVEGLRSAYAVRGDRLYLRRSGMDPPWKEGARPSIVYAHGDFEEALVAVGELPFAPGGDFPILAAFEDGSIVFEWDGQGYQLAAGEAWQIARSTDYGGGCVMTDFSALRNLGLWEAEKVEIEE